MQASAEISSMESGNAKTKGPSVAGMSFSVIYHVIFLRTQRREWHKEGSNFQLRSSRFYRLTASKACMILTRDLSICLGHLFLRRVLIS